MRRACVVLLVKKGSRMVKDQNSIVPNIPVTALFPPSALSKWVPIPWNSKEKNQYSSPVSWNNPGIEILSPNHLLFYLYLV
jgi:hypothetical protein